jgi:tungstate transport system substrate-binding protein
MHRRCLPLGLLAAAILTTGCSQPGPSVTLATTTSMQDSGLLDVLVPRFRGETGVEIRVVAVGTGQALELARRGDADVLLVHDPDAEEQFMAEGHGSLRREVMYNDFVLVGPEADPAHVLGPESITEAFTWIARSRAPFVSRGDESGTHQKERQIWGRARIEPQGDWYVRAGTGMGAVLRMAGEKRAYTLSDRGTYIAQRKGLDLTILSQGDPLLVNLYHVIVVNHQTHPGVREKLALQFADYLVAPDSQKLIAEFGKDRYGQPLFFPGSPKPRPGR